LEWTTTLKYQKTPFNVDDSKIEKIFAYIFGAVGMYSRKLTKQAIDYGLLKGIQSTKK